MPMAHMPPPAPGQEPTGEPPPFALPTDDAALAELEAAGIGEGDFDGDHHVPADLLELHEAIEAYQAGLL